MPPQAAERFVWAIGHLPLEGGERVLEVGCGHGVAVTLLAERVGPAGDVLAVDRSAAMVAAAERRNREQVEAGRVEVRRAAFEDAALPADAFDLLFAFNVALFWRRAASALPEARRVLRPDGVLALFGQEPAWTPSFDADVFLDAVSAALEGHGFRVEQRLVMREPDPSAGVLARPA